MTGLAPEFGTYLLLLICELCMTYSWLSGSELSVVWFNPNLLLVSFPDTPCMPLAGTVPPLPWPLSLSWELVVELFLFGLKGLFFIGRIPPWKLLWCRDFLPFFTPKLSFVCLKCLTYRKPWPSSPKCSSVLAETSLLFSFCFPIDSARRWDAFLTSRGCLLGSWIACSYELWNTELVYALLWIEDFSIDVTGSF